MEQYIPKSALVAEIDKRIMDAPINYIGHQRVWAYNDVKDILDTLEVKEVDLNKETSHYLLHEHRSPLNEIMHKADLNAEMQYHEDIKNAFKAGYELGIQQKAQKGE